MPNEQSIVHAGSIIQRMLIIAFFFTIAFSGHSQEPKDSVYLFVEQLVSTDYSDYTPPTRWFVTPEQSDNISNSIQMRIEKAKERTDSSALLVYFKAQAILLEWTGKEREATSQYDSALSLALLKGLDAEASTLFLRLANLNERFGRFDLAFEQYLKGLAMAESVTDTLKIIDSYLGIARIYQRLEEPKTSVTLISRCEKLGQGIFENVRGKNVLMALTLLYVELGNTDRANHAVRKLSEIKGISGDTAMCWNKFVAGKILFESNNEIAAERKFTEVISTSKTCDPYVTAQSLFYLASIRFQQGLATDAIALLQRCARISKENSYNEVLLNSYDLSVQIYRKINDLKNLALYQSHYINQIDLVFGEKILVKLSSLQAEFATREESKILHDQVELMKINEQLLSKQKKINAGIAISIMMLMGGLIVLYQLNKQKKAFNRTLDRIVQERTAELEQKQIELQQSISETTLEFISLKKQLRIRLSTLEGIYYLMSRDQSASVNKEKLKALESMILELKDQLTAMDDEVNTESGRW